ncbi:methyltransferase [Streptomyces sp. NPDC127068]|uniref:methyltransferase n=1 Tax=Streptomyces sp. NPDC127068 TaxID=3347127 RepID=UPI0036481EA5
MPWRELSHDDIDVLLHGHIAFQLLGSAHELGLFDHLSAHPGATARETAAATGLAEGPFAVLLGGLPALSLVTDDGGRLRNAPAVERTLVTGRETNRTALLGMHRHLVYPGVGDLLASLQRSTNVGLLHFPGAGDTLYTRLADRPRLEKVLHDGLHALSKAAFDGLIRSAVLTGNEHVLDIGGGDGSNALALARAYGSLTVTIVDLPSVLRITEANVTEAGLRDRVRWHAADFLTEPLPEGADTVLMAHVLPIFPPRTNRRLLAKAHAALPSGGRVLISNTMQDDTEDGPVMPMLFSAYFLSRASGSGCYYPWAHHEQWLRETGFTEVRRLGGMPYAHGLCVATKP